MRSNFSPFFIRIIYFIYVGGLISLFGDVIGTITMKGNIFMLFTIFRFFIPVAGLAGLVPYPLLFFYIPFLFSNTVYSSLLYFVIRFSIFPIIVLHKMFIDRMKVAITKNEKENPVFKIVVMHNILVTLILVPGPVLGLFNKEWGLGWVSKLIYGYPALWIFCGTINILVSLGVWIWIKTENKVRR